MLFLAPLALLAFVQDATPLTPDQPAHLKLLYGLGGLVSYQVDVPDDKYAMLVTLTDSTHNLDLDASRIVEDAYSENYYFADNAWYDRTLYIPVTEPYGLVPGLWQIDVMVPDGFGQVLYQETAEAHVNVTFPEPLRGELVPDQIYAGELSLNNALRVILDTTQIDDDTEYLVEAYSPYADIDLMIVQPLVYKMMGVPAALEFTALNYESTTLKGDLLKSCEVHVYAHSGSINRQQLPVRVRLRPAGQAAESLIQTPHWPNQALPLDARRERALQAAVAVFGDEASGSGSLISSTGLILTSAHVVPSPPKSVHPTGTSADFLANTVRGHYAGFPVDLANAPMPEVGLQLLDYRSDLDLALLRIHSTLDGLPIAVPALNFVEINRNPQLELGAPLYSLGYPMTGGTGKFVSLTLGRGILSGRAQQIGSASLKTDAPMHSGCSGGMLLNADWQLVGVPDMNIQDSNGTGGIGFGIPVEEIPASWMELTARPDLDQVLQTMSDGSLAGIEPMLGGDYLGLALDVRRVEFAVEDLFRRRPHGQTKPITPQGQVSEANLQRRLPQSLGAFVAFAEHDPERANLAIRVARSLAPNATLPASDEPAAWRALWDGLVADPDSWSTLGNLDAAAAEAYLATLAVERERNTALGR